MRVFISEFVCGGGWPDGSPRGSLAREGGAMLSAVVEDFTRIPGVRATTTWDSRLGAVPFDCAQTITIDSPDDELPIFRELAHLCEATLVIAPETGGLLTERCRIVEGARGRLLGSGSDAVDTCTSKFTTSRRLEAAGVPTLPTIRRAWPHTIGTDGSVQHIQFDVGSLAFPLVIKPDDGAGSQNTFLLRDRDELARLPPIAANESAAAAVQTFVPGRPVSVALLVDDAGEPMHVFPPAEQTLSDDGRFVYLGGRVPARGVDLAAIQAVARAACGAVSGLRGYVGVDIIVPDDHPDRPLVVEINPRLTTSYIGYRRLTDDNLAARMLRLDDRRSIVWRDAHVRFAADGTID